VHITFAFVDQNMIASFEEWRAELLELGDIVQDIDETVSVQEAERRFNRYLAMLEGLNGNEGFEYALAVFESIRAEQDYGVYQVAERAAFRFGEVVYCKVLMHELPRLIDTLPALAGDFLVSIANGQGTAQQGVINTFNKLLTELEPSASIKIRSFIAKEENGGWFSHCVGVLGNNG
jgi:hypothetical protein